MKGSQMGAATTLRVSCSAAPWRLLISSNPTQRWEVDTPTNNPGEACTLGDSVAPESGTSPCCGGGIGQDALFEGGEEKEEVRPVLQNSQTLSAARRIRC